MLLIGPNNEYPRFIGDLQIAHPDFNLGDTLPEGWREVVPVTTFPEITENEKYEEVEPVLVDGVLTQKLVVVPLTADEIAWRDAPKTAKAKLTELGLTEIEIQALTLGLVR